MVHFVFSDAKCVHLFDDILIKQSEKNAEWNEDGDGRIFDLIEQHMASHSVFHSCRILPRVCLPKLDVFKL